MTWSVNVNWNVLIKLNHVMCQNVLFICNTLVISVGGLNFCIVPAHGFSLVYNTPFVSFSLITYSHIFVFWSSAGQYQMIDTVPHRIGCNLRCICIRCIQPAMHWAWSIYGTKHADVAIPVYICGHVHVQLNTRTWVRSTG